MANIFKIWKEIQLYQNDFTKVGEDLLGKGIIFIYKEIKDKELNIGKPKEKIRLVEEEK